jgi:hypothetical protein
MILLSMAHKQGFRLSGFGRTENFEADAKKFSRIFQRKIDFSNEVAGFHLGGSCSVSAAKIEGASETEVGRAGWK